MNDSDNLEIFLLLRNTFLSPMKNVEKIGWVGLAFLAFMDKVHRTLCVYIYI